MNSRPTKLILTFAIVSGLIAQPAHAETYVVQQGDWLARIARRVYGKPVFGANGSLERLLSQNENLKSHVDVILVGEIIQFGAQSTAAPLASVAVQAPAPEAQAPVPTAPIKERAPASVEVVDEQQSHFFFGPRFGYNRLDAEDKVTGGQATLGSALSYGAELQWIQTWSNNWSSAISVGFDQLTEQSANLTIERPTFTKTELSASLAYHFSDCTSASLQASATASPFIRAATSQSVTVETVNVPSIQLGLEHDFVRGRLLTFGLGVNGGYRLATSQSGLSVDAGSNFGANASISQTNGRFPLKANLFFSQLNQGTSRTTQKETVLGLSLGAFFDLGGSSK